MTLKRILDLHIGCFGAFSSTDPVCTDYCALRLSCAVENEINSKMELLEDLIYSSDDMVRIQ